MVAAAASEAERWRVFVAIEPPESVRVRLQAPIDGLEPLRDWVRVNAVERIHLTLHFLGLLPAAEVEALTPMLKEVVVGFARMELRVERVGAFPNLGRPQVLWAGLGGPDLARLTAMQADLGSTLRAAGLGVEDRFHAHLTLARVRRPIRGPARKLLQQWHARWLEASFGEFTAADVRLMRSRLGAGPPRYSTLATFSLQ